MNTPDKEPAEKKPKMKQISIKPSKFKQYMYQVKIGQTLIENIG